MILSIVAIVISVLSACFTIYSFVWTARRDRKQATLDAYNTLQNQALDILIDYTLSDVKKIIADDNKGECRELSKCLARLEHFSVGVITQIYDRKTVYELAHGHLDVAVWYKLQPLLEQKHKDKKEEYYQNYRRLVQLMKVNCKDN